MNRLRRTLIIAAMTTSLAAAFDLQLPIQAGDSPSGFDFAFQARAAGRTAEDRGLESYRQGSRAIDERDYDRAIRSFDRVIEVKSSRSDGAYYWKAYALNKQGKRDDALAALAEIARQFPQSRWLNDARALEVEVKQAAGQSVSPETQADEDLKLYAINALINTEPDRAIPLLERVLNDTKNSLSLKKRALFVLSQSRSDKARDIVGQYAKNGSNPDLQLTAVEYLGIFRSKESRQTLADIYASVNDVNVKRSVLRGFMISRDAERLVNAARNESNPDLRREAIVYLGALRAQDELGQLYSTETNHELRTAIIQAIRTSGSASKLVEIARNEKDPELKKKAVQMLSVMKSKEATDYLAELLK